MLLIFLCSACPASNWGIEHEKGAGGFFFFFEETEVKKQVAQVQASKAKQSRQVARGAGVP
jgi:hypothetical protein